jgi:hypothetical protein
MAYSYTDLPWTRARVRRLRDQFTDGKPGSGDDPIGTQTLAAQVMLVENLEVLIERQASAAGAGGAQEGGRSGEFAYEIDPAISYGENKERIRKLGVDEGFQSDEKAKREAERSEAEREARKAAVDYLIDECMRIEQETGAGEANGEGVEALESVIDGEAPDVPGGEQLLNDAEDIREEFGLTVLTDAADRCREMARPTGEEMERADNDELLDRFQSVLGERPVTVDDGFARVERRIERKRELAAQNFVNRLATAFGGDFEDVDDAVESIRDRFTELQGFDVRTGDILLRGNREFRPSVSVEIGFGTFEQDVREQVDRAIDRDAIDVSRRFEEQIGSVRVVDDAIQSIDLTRALVVDPVAAAITDRDQLFTRREVGVDVAGVPEPTVAEDEAPEPVEVPEPEPEPEPEPAGEPEEPEEPEPATPDAELSDSQLEALELALEAAPGGVIAVAETLTTAQAFDLAGAVSQESLAEDDRARIADAFQQASAGERRRAAQLQDGVGDLQRALIGVGPGESEDIDIEITGDVAPGDLNGDDEEEGFLGGIIGEAEPGGPPDEDNGNGNGDGLNAEDIVEGLSDLFAGAGESIKTQPGPTRRPDPNQQNADRKLAPLLGNRLLTAQAWVAAEQERLSRDFDDPGQFWDAFAGQIWGNNLSREQFVTLEVPQ